MSASPSNVKPLPEAAAPVKFGGFSIASGKVKTASAAKPRAAVLNGHDDDDGDIEHQREFVRAIDDKGVESLAPKQNRGPLVIPLATNPWQNKTDVTQHTEVKVTVTAQSAAGTVQTQSTITVKTQKKEKTLDELAAEAILAEANEGSSTKKLLGMGMDSDRVIAMQAHGDGTSKGGAQGDKRAAPLLAKNMIPGMAQISGEDAKFRHDLSVRADDMDVRDGSYNAVPIEEYGAALLRGMGWKGPQEDDQNVPRLFEPRHHRLGLGAAPKPPEESDSKRRKKPGEKPRALEEETRKAWQAKAKASGQADKITLGDLVHVSRSAREHGGQRAMVLKTQGVPGLGKILVRLEEGGAEAIVARADVVVLGESERLAQPFQVRRRDGQGGGRENGLRDNESAANGDGSRERRKEEKKKKKKKRDRSRSRSHSRSRDKSDRKKHRRRDGDASSTDPRPQSTHRSDPRGDGRSRPPEGRASPPAAAAPRAPPPWLRTKIRVRVVSKGVGGGRHFRLKGTVLDVPQPRCATVRMDSGSLLEGVAEAHLETVIPAVGGKVVLLRDPDKGLVGKVLEKDTDAERAVVQLYQDMRLTSVSLDDVTEYTGMLDEDMDEYM